MVHTPSPSATASDADLAIQEVLQRFAALTLAMVFGSVAKGQQHPASDLDIAVAAKEPLSTTEKMDIIRALAQRTGRPIDLIDLNTVTEPLRGQILRHGRRLAGSDETYARLISQHLFDQADFMPYHRRILAERRAAWIGT